ncbi:hypothetical protein OAF44_04355 [Akkermansiaceae bacterium]|nr:hypothetical protein [Akkermansiaceae bacterium]
MTTHNGDHFFPAITLDTTFKKIGHGVINSVIVQPLRERFHDIGR